MVLKEIKKTSKYKLGIDIGSTTVKLVITAQNGKIVHSAYTRHHACIPNTLVEVLKDAEKLTGDLELSMAITGSAGMGFSERLGWPFVQEVIASANCIKVMYPNTATLLDIGGEDSKMIFFNPGKTPDIRMNGNCAGGTGAFIDQMASLMGISLQEMDTLAANAKEIFPIASRCGVFAKTDVQNLLSRKVHHSDIAASIFNAIALQTLNSLARGTEIKFPILMCGGPLSFLESLRTAFSKTFSAYGEDFILPDYAEYIPAIGAAILSPENNYYTTLEKLIHSIEDGKDKKNTESGRLEALFADENDFGNWKKNRPVISMESVELKDYDGTPCFLGIDSGSTTTKILIADSNNRIFFKHYAPNKGNPLDAVINGLQLLNELQKSAGASLTIVASAITGYGEDLVKAALNLDFGLVETIAHYTSAKHIEPNLSFILDIGGQDMKAIYITPHGIGNIEINEACSSGCGSFIENFAQMLGSNAAAFALDACGGTSPCDLGTRCTVFMNSKVKQYLREGATVKDIAAGLNYSVIKNCLFKVLKLKDYHALGDKIVVQGGAFKNMAMVRALEKLTEKTVISPEFPELMGAFGAALYAKKNAEAESFSTTFSLSEVLDKASLYQTTQQHCKGCTNTCSITRFKFPNGKHFFSGNKCEKIIHNKEIKEKAGLNIYDYRNALIFEKYQRNENRMPVNIGIPRILNMYDNFPFWNALFSECGIEVILSDESDMALYTAGAGTIMSDNICYPAKIAHGHIMNLIDKKPDRIFYPLVIYETKDFKSASNCFNCPIVTGYSEVLKSSISALQENNIPLDAPAINFNDRGLLLKTCKEYLKQFRISSKVVAVAFEKAWANWDKVRHALREKNAEILSHAINNNRTAVVIAGRPYHADTLVHQKISEMMAGMDVDVINEDIAYSSKDETFNELLAVSQWAYPNRIMQAARVASLAPQNVLFLQLNSFGCGPDSFLIEEISDIVKSGGKAYNLLRIDDIISPGSVRLRLRSMIESANMQANTLLVKRKIHPVDSPYFTDADRHRTILAPWFSDNYSPFLPILAKIAGYKLENLPPSNAQSAEVGLKYANNEICYPNTLIVGDVIKALQSGKYNTDEVAVGITQTGGQCRATNYLSLIKKALINAGFGDIPVISVGSTDAIHNTQPGFVIDWGKLLKITFLGILYIDSISRMYHAIAARERKKGLAEQLKNKYLESVLPVIKNQNYKELKTLLKQAVVEFNAIPINNEFVPTIGIVGEIYVKYNRFGHADVISWLTNHGVEVVVPSILDFMIQSFVNNKVNRDANLQRFSFSEIKTSFFEMLANRQMRSYEKIMNDFKFDRKEIHLHEKAEMASKSINLVNQYGEGWLIAAEISAFAKQGINYVVSMQPFGCIANHVIAKGIEKRLKTLHPEMNLLYLDFDSGVSPVNILNRLHFMLHSAKEQANESTNKNTKGKNAEVISETDVLKEVPAIIANVVKEKQN